MVMGNVGGMGNASQLINMPQGKHCSGCSFPIHTQRPDFSSHHEAERRQGSEETDKTNLRTTCGKVLWGGLLSCEVKSKENLQATTELKQPYKGVCIFRTQNNPGALKSQWVGRKMRKPRSPKGVQTPQSSLWPKNKGKEESFRGWL